MDGGVPFIVSEEQPAITPWEQPDQEFTERGLVQRVARRPTDVPPDIGEDRVGVTRQRSLLVGDAGARRRELRDGQSGLGSEPSVLLGLQRNKGAPSASQAFSPVGRSLLTDHPLSREAIADLPFLSANERFQDPNLAYNLDATDRFRALAAEMGEPAAALANAWLLAQGEHVIPIPGTRSVAHFRECVRGGEIELSAGDLARIDAVLPVGWCHGDRYNKDQWIGPERFC